MNNSLNKKFVSSFLFLTFFLKISKIKGIEIFSIESFKKINDK